MVGYFLVRYFMYLGMGTYNELFLLWAVLLLLALQAFIRLALGLRDEMQSVPANLLSSIFGMSLVGAIVGEASA